MNVTLVSMTEDGDHLAGMAAATCTRAQNWGKALEYALNSGHESVLEHVSATFRVEGVSRVLLAQLTRHRIASYSVESERYCDVNGNQIVIPNSIRKDQELYGMFLNLIYETQLFYQEAERHGIPKEDARYGTLQGISTTLLVTMNARELRHFFSLRCCNRAQWEIRELADRMLALCKKKAPMLFKDAGPGCVRGRCPEEKPCGDPRMEEALFR